MKNFRPGQHILPPLPPQNKNKYNYIVVIPTNQSEIIQNFFFSFIFLCHFQYLGFPLHLIFPSFIIDCKYDFTPFRAEKENSCLVDTYLKLLILNYKTYHVYSVEILFIIIIIMLH